MNKIFLFFALLTFASSASASTGFWSQFSHFSGGFLGTILAAYIILRYVKKYKDKAVMHAAILSTVYAFIDQMQQYIRHGKFWGQAYDFAAHTLGTILAIYLLIWLIKVWRARSSGNADNQNQAS